MKHGKFTKWNWIPYHPENIKPNRKRRFTNRYEFLGKKVDIGAETCLFAHEGIEFGNDIQVGSLTSIYSYDSEDNIRGKVVISDGARIGTHCTIFPNVIIERKEKIKAHSVVYVDQKGKRHIKEVREYK